MIKASELRLGNLVFDHFDERIIRVDGIEEDGDIGSIHSEGVVRQLSSGAISPVKLSPEILRKAGFYKLARFGETYTKGTKLAIQKDSCYWWVNAWQINDNEFEPLTTWTEITSVHQLQNLYFVLIGQELKIAL